MDIKDFGKGQVVIDVDGKECTITNLTSSSIEVYIEKKTVHGINCKQWFRLEDFVKRFRF